MTGGPSNGGCDGRPGILRAGAPRSRGLQVRVLKVIGKGSFGQVVQGL